jgi:HK97 gp10 family phage protein
MTQIHGFEKLTKQLSAMGMAVGKKTLRAAAMQAMLPALRTAQRNAPVGAPPYESRTSERRDGDPYPTKTYKGRYKTPGFAKRNVARKAIVSKDGRSVQILLGVKPEAFYAVQFIELGYGKVPRRPWLEPAFRSSLPAVDRRFKERLKALIDKAAKK